MNIVIATNNLHKVKEIQSILKDFTVKSLNDIGLNLKIDETGQSFAENSLIKAEVVRNYVNEIILADDSGLEVDALQGAPGVQSARFAGENATDYMNREKLIMLLREKKLSKSKARFICVMTCMINNHIFQSKGILEGEVTVEAKGSNGFGYDPLFIPANYNKTLSELNEVEKNAISHRFKALEEVQNYLNKHFYERLGIKYENN
jgi:XTP/dITP diphosphohydrolase